MVRRLVVILLAACVFAPVASAGPPTQAPSPDVTLGGYLGFCARKASFAKEWSCYVQNLERDVLTSKSPATELPRLDGLAQSSGGFLASNCHMMMHVVGRDFARRHHVTLATLQQYLPLSNNPGCSAGFGMGMTMALAPQITRGGPKGAEAICDRQATRFRVYTCYHSLGHAYMRYYDGFLSYGLKACNALRAIDRPDCAQGVFHDFWLGLSGQDNAKANTRGEPKTARGLCARQKSSFVLGCWYRYYLSLPPKQLPTSAARIDALCRGMAGVQRTGCVAAASLISDGDPFVQLRICSHLAPADVDACLRGVGVQNLAGKGLALQLRLISSCGKLAPLAQAGCYGWFGTTLQVVTNGAFAKRGCTKLHGVGAQQMCVEGARRSSGPLVTFA
jgi:hypothetical protein